MVNFGRHMVAFGRNVAKPGPTYLPELDRVRSNAGQIGSHFGRCRTPHGRLRIGRNRRVLAKFGRFWAGLGRSRAKFGQGWWMSNPILSILGRMLPKLVDFGAALVESDMADLGQCWSMPGQDCPISAELGPNLVDVSANVAEFNPVSACSSALGPIACLARIHIGLRARTLSDQGSVLSKLHRHTDTTTDRLRGPRAGVASQGAGWPHTKKSVSLVCQKSTWRSNILCPRAVP